MRLLVQRQGESVQYRFSRVGEELQFLRWASRGPLGFTASVEVLRRAVLTCLRSELSKGQETRWENSAPAFASCCKGQNKIC